MKHPSKTRFLIDLSLIGLMIAGAPHAPRGTHAEELPSIRMPDTQLLAQDGNPVRFADDVARGRIIALSFIYTDCRGVCPVMSAIFSKLQDRLADKLLTDDVRLVSVSIDPVKDTPERLKDSARRFRARPEWIWLTGEPYQVTALLKALGVYSPDITGHTPVVLVGDPDRGVWTRLNGFSSPETIAAKIDELLAARHEKS